MAKGPRRAGKPTARARSSKPNGEAKKAFPLIARGDLSRLLEQTAIYQNRIASQSGSLREMIGDYAKKKHLHTPAFNIIARLHRMGARDPQALWLLLAHFDDMREKCGLDRIAKAQGQLLPAISEEGGEPQEEEQQNVTTFPQAREVEERAGDAA